MVISIFEKIKLIFLVWSCIPRVPLRTKINLFFKPAESTRFTEIIYILNFLKNDNHKLLLSLDVSSPFILSYILSKKGKVIKTDIFPDEKKNIKESENLKFEIQNALDLIYNNNTFDFVYSISAVEHIHNGLYQAVNEMIRVVKPNRYIYLSFPVSYKFQEEWLKTEIYSDQFKKDGQTFFQYRFDKESLDNFFDSLENVKVIKKDIYWEKKNGSYNDMINKLKKSSGVSSIDFLKNSVLNLYYGFTLLNDYPENFDKAKDLGNISIVLKKIANS